MRTSELATAGIELEHELRTSEGMIPLRWDPSCIAYSGRGHVRKVCRICGQPFAVMPPGRARYYQTCSEACGRTLRSLVRKGVPWSEKARAARARRAERHKESS